MFDKVLNAPLSCSVKIFGKFSMFPFHNIFTALKMEFSITDFFSKCEQIFRKLRIWSHLLKKSINENFIFCVVFEVYSGPSQTSKTTFFVKKNETTWTPSEVFDWALFSKQESAAAFGKPVIMLYTIAFFANHSILDVWQNYASERCI